MHLPESKDTLTILCINKFDVDRDIAEIGDELMRRGYIYDDLNRIKNHKGENKTLVCFKLADNLQSNKIKKEGLPTNNIVNPVRDFIDREKLVIRCSKCQSFGHTFRSCRKNKLCEMW